jgi:hypothetical protein
LGLKDDNYIFNTGKVCRFGDITGKLNKKAPERALFLLPQTIARA